MSHAETKKKMGPRQALVAAMWAALCGAASAQTPSSERGADAVSEERGQGGPTQTAAASDRGDAAAELEVELMGTSERRASELIGASVVAGDGGKVGEIDDVIVSTDGGDTKVVLAVGGLFGIGQRLIAVPLAEVEIETEGESPADDGAVESVRVTMSVDELRRRPLFRYEKRTNLESTGAPF